MEKDHEIVQMNGASPFQKGLAIFFVIVSLLYTASPVDMAPDTIPVLGWFDDFGLLATATLNAVQQFSSNQNSAMVKIVKYVKWLMIIAVVIAVLLLGGLVAAIIALIVK